MRIPNRWQAKDITDQSGKRFLITGGTSGIGLEAAREIARAGGEVIIAARNPKKADQVASQLGRERVSWVEADFASLQSVREAAKQVGEIDVLLLNAGIMAIPFTSSLDGFEMQIAVNHLGQFAFAGLISDRIKERVVTVSSTAHRMGDFGGGSIDEIEDRIIAERVREGYAPWRAYGVSKFANILFTFELERLARSKGYPFIALVVHPGYSNTNLQYVAPEMKGDKRALKAIGFVNKVFAQSASQGALPTLAAATLDGIQGGSFIGPDGFLEIRGYPRFTRARSGAYDQQVARNLWHVSESLTGVTWRK